MYGRSSLLLEGYSDADWGGDLDESKSTSGWIFMYGGANLDSGAGCSSPLLSHLLAGFEGIRGGNEWNFTTRLKVKELNY